MIEDSAETVSPTMLEMAVQIVSAYLRKNNVPAREVPKLISVVYQSLHSTRKPSTQIVQEVEEKPKPYVPIRKSIKEDYIICLEDGKKFKSLRRHLMTQYNMTPDQYREKWGLPQDYPMVSPAYSRTRSQLARDLGLGHIGRAKK